MKDDLDRTGMKKWIKTAKNSCIGMWHRMHFLDLQRLYAFWTAGLTTECCNLVFRLFEWLEPIHINQ